jgi:hypothetical protein
MWAVATTQRELAFGRAVPDIDQDILSQDLYDFFGIDRLDPMCDEFIDAARNCGLAVTDDDGDLRPDLLNAVTAAVVRGIWFGLTEAYMDIMGHVHIPRWMQTLS